MSKSYPFPEPMKSRAAVLFEAGWESIVDEVWAVTAPDAVTVRRLVDGEGHEEGAVRARMAAQMPSEEKARRARRIIRNDGDLAALRAGVEATWTEATGPRVMVPVDSMPEGQSPFGVYHLLGNVKEWVDDWYDREYYMDETHKMNPKGRVGGEFKVLKGGSWRDLRSFVYASFRNNSYPERPLEDYGFRCALGGSSSSAPKKFIRWDRHPLEIFKTEAEIPGP